MKAGILYFAAVFGAGFALGVVRTLWLEPLLGTRAAELVEMPVMLVVIIASARLVVRRFAVPAKASDRIGVGVFALGLLLLAEFSLVLWLRGLTVGEYLATRDPVSGTVYCLMLGVYVLMPLIVSRGGRGEV